MFISNTKAEKKAIDQLLKNSAAFPRLETIPRADILYMRTISLCIPIVSIYLLPNYEAKPLRLTTTNPSNSDANITTPQLPAMA